MKSDLIRREAMIEAIENIDWYSANKNGVLVAGAPDEEHAFIRYSEVEAAVKTLPTVCAAPATPGRWICGNDDQDSWYCSECGYTALPADDDCTPYELEMHYCTRCGAKMNLEG